MSDPFTDPPADSSGWIRHLIQETKRLGEVIVDEGKGNARDHAEIMKCIAELDKAQSVTERDVKVLVAKVSAAVSAAVAFVMWLIRDGIGGFG